MSKVKQIIGVSILACSQLAFSTSANAYVNFTGGPVIDISKIVKSVVQSAQEISNTLIEEENMAQKILQEYELSLQKYITDQANVRADLNYQTQADTNLFNHQEITGTHGIGATMCVDEKVGNGLTSSLCKQDQEANKRDAFLKAGEQVKSTDDMKRVRANYVAKFDQSGSGIVTASDGSQQQLSLEQHEAYVAPRILVSSEAERSEAEYNAALDASVLMAGLYENTGRTVSVDDLYEESQKDGVFLQLDTSMRAASHNLYSKAAFNHLTDPVIAEGYTGKDNLLGSIKALGTSEFGSDLAEDQMLFYNETENSGPGIAKKRKLAMLSKRNYLRLVEFEQKEKVIQVLALRLANDVK